ncbi:hypothetical protein C0J52_15343 [Blattella germanica]|nr:hypothetical protein C0J52_15343 [Blattella germanica]
MSPEVIMLTCLKSLRHRTDDFNFPIEGSRVLEFYSKNSIDLSVRNKPAIPRSFSPVPAMDLLIVSSRLLLDLKTDTLPST